MKLILWYGFFLCVFLWPETSARVYRQNRAAGSRWTNGDDNVASAGLPVAEKLTSWKFESSVDIEPGLEAALKTTRRRSRCYDEEPEASQEATVTARSTMKPPPWAGTLYSHKILHPYHDWSKIEAENSIARYL